MSDNKFYTLCATVNIVALLILIGFLCYTFKLGWPCFLILAIGKCGSSDKDDKEDKPDE